jgi:hypothetical protein
LTVRHTEHNFKFKYDFSTINRIEDEIENSEITYKLNLDQRNNDNLLAFCPIEVYERNFLHNLQKKREKEKLIFKEHDDINSTKISEPSFSSESLRTQSRKIENTKVSNSLQLPMLSFPAMERPPIAESVYTNDNMTIIDTDVPVSFNSLVIATNNSLFSYFVLRINHHLMK